MLTTFVNWLGFEILEHSPYCPDLTPLDFQLSRPLGETCRGHRFASDIGIRYK
ncbi:hypothetical protein TNCV_936071, partial [Trichonephila clavipes]